MCQYTIGIGWIIQGGKIRWKNAGNKSQSDENISRRYADGFPCVTSVTYMCVHMCAKGTAAGRLYSEKAKATRGWVPWQCHPRLHAAPPDPTEGEKIAPLSYSYLTVCKAIANQCTSIFLFYFGGGGCPTI